MSAALPQAVTEFVAQVKALSADDARTIVSAGAGTEVEQLRTTARVTAFDAAYDRGESADPMYAAWLAAFTAGVVPAAAATKARRDAGELALTDSVASDPAWAALWEQTWEWVAMAAGAIAARDYLSQALYEALTRPARAVLGPALPGEDGPNHAAPTELP
jgi:hypothetical protein